VKQEAERLAAESRLEASGMRRVRLEEALENERAVTKKEVRLCAELGTPKTSIAILAKVERSYVYELLKK
jgi:hypothetical protein